MSDVQLTVLLPLSRHLESKGSSLPDAFGDLPGAKDELTSGASRISWDLFTRIMDRSPEVLDKGDSLDDFAYRNLATQPFQLLQPILRTVTSPRDMYWLGVLWYGRHLFTIVDDRIDDLTDGRICEVLVIPPPYRECENFFWMINGALRAAPLLLGMPAAKIDCEITPRRATYWIEPGPGKRSAGWIGRLARSRVQSSRRIMVSQLIEQQEELQRTLRVRERIARIGRKLAETRDLKQLGDSLVSLLSPLIESQGIALYVKHLEKSPFELLVQSGLCKGDCDREIDLFSGDQCVGRLEVWRSVPSVFDGSVDTLAELQPWISIAIDNALRETMLGQRIEEQSRDLSAAFEEIRRHERLATIGTLAAGIAHEINNPVGAIQLAAEYGQVECGKREDRNPAYEIFANIVEEAHRCKEIVQNVLRFARDERTHKSVVNLLEVARRAAVLTADIAASRGISIDVSLPAEEWRARLNEVQMEQVISNLLRNAIEASEPGGSVKIEASRTHHHFRILVRDTGGGISTPDSERVFDPFFTTRHNQGGTGLGLAVAYGIMSEHDGDLSFRSEPGVGTTFYLKLPVPDPGDSGSP